LGGAASSFSGRPIDPMLAVGEDDEEEVMGWNNRNHDYFESDDGKDEAKDNGTEAAAVLRYQWAASCCCCCYRCCCCVSWCAQCTMMTVAYHQRLLFLNMRRWPSGWLVAGEMCLNGTQFLK